MATILQNCVLLIALLYLASALTVLAQSAEGSVGAQGDAAAQEARPSAEAALIVWNRAIIVFRAPYEQATPAQRAARAKERIEALPELGPWRIEAVETAVGNYHGVLVTVDGVPILGVLPGDLDTESGETTAQASSRAAARLRDVLEARAGQRSFPLMVRAVSLSLVATAVLLTLLWVLFRVRNLMVAYTDRRVTGPIRVWQGGVDLGPQVRSLGQAMVRWIVVGICLLLGYLWLAFVLKSFPYTQPWGDRLGSYLINASMGMATASVQAVPDLLTLLVIILLTRQVSRFVRGFLQRVEEGVVQVPWLNRETAQATRRLVVLFIWAFSLTLAYPYIPGSNTDAF